MADYQYDAFLSYRHRPADRQVAIALQNRLEQLKGPDGKKLRIFRDKTDLPISADLSDGIKEALETSRFLIVICTPAYRQSKWCMAELTRFRVLHGNHNGRILPVLVEGEPVDAFPEELFWEEERLTLPDGSVETRREEIEPLGADVRGKNPLSRLWKLRTEYLRLAAQLLGKSFDDLYQRDRRKQRWLWGSVITAVILGLAGFSLYNMQMRTRIQQEHQAMLANESLRLAVASEQQLQQGNIKLATALALEALPEDPQNPDRPLLPEAQTALRSAVYTAAVQEKQDLLQHITTVSFATWGWELRGLYGEGTVLAVNDLERLYLYDAESGNLIFDYPSDFYAKAVLNNSATRIARVGYSDMENGQQIYEMVICAVPSGEILFRQTAPAELYSITAHWDTREDVCYFVKDLYVEDAAQILAAVQADGTCISPEVTPEEIGEPRFRDTLSVEIPPAMDVALDDGQWTALAEAYRDVLEPLAEDTSCILISPDRELVLVYGARGEPDRFYSLPGLESGNTDYVALEGYFNIDTQNKRILVSDNNALHLYAYKAENLVYRDPESQLQLTYLSRDGARCLMGSDVIRSTEDLSALLSVPESTDTHLTPDLTCLLAQTGEAQLQLWSLEDGCLLTLDTENPVTMSCVNADGSLIAVQYADHAVQVFDRQGNPVMTVEGPFPETLHVLELAGTDLLLSGCDSSGLEDWSWIVDTTGQRKTVVIPDGNICQCYGLDNRNHHLTEDGLLMCSADYPFEAVEAIYDIRTGQCLFRQVSYYQYDSATGILLYMPTNPQFGDSPVLHVARRNEQGEFQDLYTVTPEDPDTIRWRSILCADDNYFLVIGERSCQVYALEDGSRLLTLYSTELSDTSADRSYFLVDGAVYDTRYARAGSLTSYPILDFSKILELAKQQLSTESGIRTLSPQERETFFLE